MALVQVMVYQTATARTNVNPSNKKTPRADFLVRRFSYERYLFKL